MALVLSLVALLFVTPNGAVNPSKLLNMQTTAASGGVNTDDSTGFPIPFFIEASAQKALVRRDRHTSKVALVDALAWHSAGRSGMNLVAHLQSTGQIDAGSRPRPIRQALASTVKEKCHASIRERPNKIDLVITWVYYKGDQALKFELRSFEKFGLLDFINNVYILADYNDVKNVELPRVNNTKFHVLTARDVINADSWCDSSHVNTAWCKYSKLHQIPGISPWVIAMPDDDVLIKKFSLDLMYNDTENLPYGYSHGGLGLGQCLGDSPTAALHGPHLQNTCVMNQVAEVLAGEWYVQRRGKVLHPNDMMDAACIATHALKRAGLLAHYFGYHGGPPGKTPLFKECHTNHRCRSPAAFQNNTMFVNIQGPGVSAEYPPDPMMHKTFTDWFTSMYPEPSRFESEVHSLLEHESH